MPIFVEEMVLEKAGVAMDQETGKPLLEGEKGDQGKERQVSEQELRSMSAFKDFIEELNFEDLDKGTGTTLT